MWASLLLALLPVTSAYLLPLTPAARVAARRAVICACDTAAPEEEATGGIISFSDRALAQLESMREKQEDGKLILRMGVRAGGCSGMSYVMDLEKPDKVDEGDTVVDLAEGMQCAIDPKSLMFLYGMQLDYSDELIGGGFSFQNPNAEETVSLPQAARSPVNISSSMRFLCSLPGNTKSCRSHLTVWLRQELRHLRTHAASACTAPVCLHCYLYSLNADPPIRMSICV
jgi:iron-sulfur cluster assembly accessory protein